MSPLYFSLEIHDLLSSLHSEFFISYLDDIAMGGEARIVAEDFLGLKENAAKLGLKLNKAKCEVIGHTDVTRASFSIRQVTIKETELDDAILLGSPLGSNVDKILSIKQVELQNLATRLPYMPAHEIAVFVT